MKKRFENKAAGFWLGGAAAVLALAGLLSFVIAAIYGSGMVTRDAVPEAAVCVLFGVAAEVLAAGNVKWEFWKLFSPIAYFAALMFLAVNRMGYVTSLAGKSGNYLQPSIVLAVALLLLSSVLALVSVFLRERKAAP